MNARQKLNLSYFNGTVLVAGVVGSLMGSWVVCLGCLAVLLLVNVMSSEIRFGNRRK